MRAVSIVGVAVLLCLVACSDDDKDDADDKDDNTPDVTTSTVEGRVDAASFAANAPTGVDAINEAGARVNAPLGADGAFTLTLTKDHSYELVVLTPAGEVPIVHPRGTTRIVKNFHVDDGNMVLQLGVVRRLEKAPDGGFTTPLAPSTCAAGVAADPDDDDDDDKDRDPAPPAEKDADPAQPFALPDSAAPATFSGCND